MGYYINDTKNGALGASFLSKCTGLEKAGAKLISDPTKFKEGLVWVVDNGMFAAAAYAYSEGEMNEFLTSTGGRPYQWFQFDEAKEWAK